MEKFTIEQIGAKVLDVLADVTGATPAEMTMDASLVHDLGCDSMDIVEIVMGLEDAFGFAIDEDKADAFVHVRDVVAYLQKEIGSAI